MIVAALATSQGWMAEIAYEAASGLIAAVWQGVVLSFIVALGLRLLPKTPAAVRFAIWFAVFVVVAMLPSVGLLHGTAASNGHTPWLTLDRRWCLIVATAWGITSLVRVITLLLAVLRVHTLWKRATPFEFESAGMAQADKPHNFARLCQHAGSRYAQLCVSDEVDRPAVIGFFSPKILIPAWLVEKLSADELKQIVLHEAGHLSRADDWMNLLQKVALVVFPLNPALAWVERRLCFERELACDERVLETTGAPKLYASCLASLAEHRLGRRGLALALGALGRESELGRRVRRILWRGERMRPLQARLVLGGAMLGLLAAAAGLERCPQVVGFAPAAYGVAAADEPVRVDDAARNVYHYQPVVFHSAAVPSLPARVSKSRTSANAGREGKPTQSAVATRALLQASLGEPVGSYDMTSAPENVGRQSGRSQEVSNLNAGLQNVQLQDVEIQPEVRGVVHWSVVTSWREDDGSAIVLTTVRAVSSRNFSHDGLGAASAVPQDQVHPYAAVPVRDGWLVFQL